MFSNKRSIDNRPIAHDFNQVIYVDENKQPNSIKTNHEFHLIPRSDGERELIYITGSSGCGKTTFIKNYCELYHKIYPESPIYLFSEKIEEFIESTNLEEIMKYYYNNYSTNEILE